MESLKSLIPEDLRQTIHTSTVDDLSLTCSKLLDCFNPLPQFHKAIGELADPELGLCGKSEQTALDFKKKGNDCFRSCDYRRALKFYTEALRFAPVLSDGPEKDLISTLYVNRASSMHKLELFVECRNDCDRAIGHSPNYIKAWYRKAKANASLKCYEDAARDFKAALSMNCSHSEKDHIGRELEELLRLEQNIIETRTHGISNNQLYNDDEQSHIELHCVPTETKGRGMISLHDIRPSTLIHEEEPFAAIVSKACRETHCHYCFDELQAGMVFCPLCVTAVYCSDRCRELAGVDHNHECGGSNWSAVLPFEGVLAGRVIAKFIRKKDATDPSEAVEHWDLAHNYCLGLPGRKLELHIYSVVLAYCLHMYFRLKFLITGVTVSQLVILLSQIKVNAMTVVCMKSKEYHAQQAQDNRDSGIAYTSDIEQARVGHGIYLTGRFFNHSCQPNIHAYFLSRKLFIRSTEFVPAEFPLEISYGPQIGQCDFMERQMSLKNEYSFDCHCTGCSEINLPDIVLHSFCCSKTNCLGAVTACDIGFQDDKRINSVPLPICPVVLEMKQDAIKEVADLVVHHHGVSVIVPGRCLCCGSTHDVNLLNQKAKAAMSAITKLQQDCSSGSVTTASVSTAVNSLNSLKSTRHAYSRDLAHAEDIVAKAFCLLGKFESALEHCRASLKILRKLYHENHIVVGNELVKLASLQLHLGQHPAANGTLKKLKAIFTLHYGSHASRMFPYLEDLGKQFC